MTKSMSKKRAMTLFCPVCKNKAYSIYLKNPNYRSIPGKRYCDTCKEIRDDRECWTTRFAKNYTANMSAGVRNKYLKMTRADPLLGIEKRISE